MELLRPRGAAAPAAAGGPPATRPLRRSGIKRRMLIPIQKFSSNTARQGAEDLVSLKDIECGGGEAPSGDETTPRRLPQTLQDTAANRLAVASLALNRGIQCERGSSQDTIVELGSSRGPAVAEMLPPAHRRIFYSILTHGADDARSGNRERPERSPSNEMVEARGVAEGDENPDSAEGPQAQCLCCNCSRCRETMRGWGREVWTRETSFILREETEASQAELRKRKENPDVKASHVILAAQNKGSRESLTLCPLRYTDKSMEKEFAYNQERTARFRNVLAGLFASFLVVVDIILYTMAWHAGVFAHDVFVFRSSITFFVCCTIFCLSYAFSYRIPYVKGYLEYTSYFIATSAVVVHCVLVLWWKSSLYTQENFVKFAPSVSKLFGMTFDSEDPPDKKDSPIYHFVVLFNELFMGISFQSTILIIYVLFDVLSPTRFFIVSRIQGLNTILGTIPFIYGATQLPETLLPNTATIVCICTISAAGFVGSYPMELRRRGLFFEWLSMKRAVANLLNIRRRAQKAAGSSSALDDIRSNLNQALEILTDMKANSGKFDVAAGVSQALTLVQESLFIFSTCKNLYLTNVDEDLKDESFIKAFNIGGSQARNLLNAESAISSTVGGNSRVGGKFGQGTSDVHSRAGQSMIPAGEMEAHNAALLLPVVGIDLGFDPLEFERSHSDGRSSVLLDAGTALLARVAADWGCEDVVLRNFLVQIDALYQKQPYHNAKHGTLVAHSMSLLCRTLGIFREMNALGVGSCLVAGLCHDVGHPGRNNNFFVAEMSPLSILYNDASVLENFHSSLTFRVLADPSCNLFALLSDAEVREVRSKIIDLILATDMRTHFEFLNRFRTIRESDQFSFRRNDDDRWLAVELCIRASDIGHGVLGWKQHFEWTARATTEFYLQGDEEARLGRTISPLCDRETHSQLAKSQVGFLRHVVRPLFAELQAIDDQKKPIAEMLKNLDTNCERWEELGKAEELIVFPYIVRELDAGMKGLPHYLDISILTREDGLKNPRPSSKSCKCKCYRLKKNNSSQQDDGSSLGDKALSHERSVVSLSDQAGSAEGSAEKESPGTSSSGKEQASEAPAKEAAPSADPSQSAPHLKDSAPEAKPVDEAAHPKSGTEGEVEKIGSQGNALGKAVPGASVEASGVPYGGSHDGTQKHSPTDNSAHDENIVADRAASLAQAATKPSDKTSQLPAEAGEPHVGFALPPAAEDPSAANATPHKRAWSIESNDDSPVPGIDQTFFWS